MLLDAKLIEYKELLQDLYDNKYDIKEGNKMVHLKNAILELNLALNGEEVENGK